MTTPITARGGPLRQMLPFLTIALTLLFATFTTAESRIRNPLTALSTVQNATIHTHNHRLTHLSKFDLSFTLRDDLHVKFHLEPNPDILPDGAKVTYMAPDGSVRNEEPMSADRHRVYKGSSWVTYGEENKWRRVGWARCVVHREGKMPLFEGAFSVEGDHHHIQTSHNYMRTKHTLDPAVEVATGEEEEYLVLWRDSDLLSDRVGLGLHQELRRELGEMEKRDLTCRSDEVSFNTNPDHPVFKGGIMRREEKSWGVMDISSLFGMTKRQIDGTTGGNSAGVNLVQTIGQTAGCPDTKKVALVGVATDCTYTQSFNSTESARQNVINQMNTASGIWEDTFNISLGLHNLIVQDASCPGTPNEATLWNQDCSDDVDIQDRLNMFSAWRGQQEDTNSHWTLLSTCNTESAVGLAWLGQACVQDAITTNGSTTGNGDSTGTGTESVAGANVVIRTAGANEWQIIAHETGHTYGAVHDCTSSACANADFVNSQQCCPLSTNQCDAGEQYIMNPSTSSGVSQFSMCSVGNICAGIGRNSIDISCLSDNKGVTTISGQQCGNGIVEEGEDCDCGGAEGCGDNSCCNPETCEFSVGAVCDDANEDCCRDCQFANNGTVCRASTGDCDPQEVCPGNTALCPDDVTAPDGDKCGDGLSCASGQCTSRDMQCKIVMGSYTEGNDTYACDSSDCRLSCASPEFGPGVCYGMQQNFLDGTSCSGGGRCRNGQCKGASAGGQIKSWIDDHKAIVIGICSAIGAILLFSILGCIGRCCKRRRHRKSMPSGRPPPPPAASWGGWRGDPRPGQGYYHPGAQPHMQQQQPQFGGQWNGHPSQGWGSQSGQGWGSAPPVPPPAYAPRAGPGGGSVRYA